MYAGVIASAHQASGFVDSSFARWSFDEGSGTTTADRSGNGFTMTANGSPWSATGHTGAGLTAVVTNANFFAGTLGAGTITTFTLML